MERQRRLAISRHEPGRRCADSTQGASGIWVPQPNHIPPPGGLDQLISLTTKGLSLTHMLTPRVFRRTGRSAARWKWRGAFGLIMEVCVCVLCVCVCVRAHARGVCVCVCTLRYIVVCARIE